MRFSIPTRRKTCTATVAGLNIGSDYPVRVQTMANTDTNDIKASVEQALSCQRAGAELLRFTTQGQKEVESLRRIKTQLHEQGCLIPLVADVHFQASVADTAAVVADKVRINPGNYIDPARRWKQLEYTEQEYAQELNRLEERFTELIRILKENHTCLRLGVNHGSLSDRIMSRYGDTKEGMAESMMEFLRVCKKLDFKNVVLSIKASAGKIMVQTVRLLIEEMQKEDMSFPLHLGVTEAGEGEDGRLKSAVGIGALLQDGIGDTIRVSLSEKPENEIPVAKELRDYIYDPQSSRYVFPQIFIDSDSIIYQSDEPTDWSTFSLHAAADLGKHLFDNSPKALTIKNHHFTEQQLHNLSNDIMQAAGLIRYKTEFVSCPGCGRTLYDLESTIQEVRQAIDKLTLPHPPKIAIMGCIVNGPGEMADADYGYVGAARGKVSLYKGKQIIEQNIPQAEAVEHLVKLILSDL